MPPKAKGKKAVKGKSSAAEDGLSTDEMSKDQLEEHIVRLREELDREQEERSYFQLERDKIRAFWEISKRHLEETRAELRNQRRETEEAEERHRVEVTVYKQKLKHVLSEHHVTVSGLKTDLVSSDSLVQNQNTDQELDLLRDLHLLQADFGEKKLYSENIVKELKLKHQVELMELTQQYDQRIREIQEKFQAERQAAVDEVRKRRSEFVDLEDAMKSHVQTVMAAQEQNLRQMQQLYSVTQNYLLQEQNRLKEQVAAAAEQRAQSDRKLSAAEEEKRRLSDALKEVQLKVSKQNRLLQEYQQAKTKADASRARVKVVEKELRELKVEHGLLLQAFQKVQRERDELLRRQTALVLDVQQKCGVKAALLQAKLSALTETAAKKDAQLCAALQASVATTANDKPQETLEPKNVVVDVIQSETVQH